MVQQGGVCVKHGAKIKQCKENGCTNNARKGGVCLKHGAKKKQCKVDGCTNGVINGGVCIKHGAKIKHCKEEGCTKFGLKGGKCMQHGGGRRCSNLERHQFEMKTGEPAPVEYARVRGKSYCHGCFFHLFPLLKKKRAVRREILFLAELQRRLPQLWNFFVNWDCPVGKGACSSRYKPDMMWNFHLWYLHVEFDEAKSHEQCIKRIDALSRDMEDFPGIVLRVCGSGMFKRLTNGCTGQRTWEATPLFKRRMIIIVDWMNKHVVPFLGEESGLVNPNAGQQGKPKIVKFFF